MRSTERVPAAVATLAVFALLLVSGAQAQPVKHPKTVGRVTRITDYVWAAGHGSSVSSPIAISAGTLVKTYGGGQATVTLKLGSTTCTTAGPVSFAAAPKANVIMRLLTGTLACKILDQQCILQFQIGRSNSIRSCDPVFVATIKKGKTVVKVTRGYALVAGRSGPAGGVIAVANQQVTVAPGQNPSRPQPAVLSPSEKRVASLVSAGLPPIAQGVPTVTIAGPVDGYSGPSPRFSFTSTRASVVYLCVLDGAPWRQCGATPSYPGLDEGSHSLLVRAVDRTGRVGPVAKASWQVDATAPTTSIACDGSTCGDGWYARPVAVALSATDAGSGVASIRYTLDGSEPTASNGSTYTAPIVLSTATTLRYRAFDKAGNAEATQTASIHVDTQPPTVSITSPLSGATVTSPVAVTATAADDNGIKSVTFLADANPQATTNVVPYRATLFFFGQGEHTITARALDVAGHTTETTIKIFVALPNLTVRTGPDHAYLFCAGTSTCNLSVQFTVTNTGAGGAGPFTILLSPDTGSQSTVNVDGLAARASATYTQAVPPGTTSVTITADSTNAVAETNENDNATTATQQPPARVRGAR